MTTDKYRVGDVIRLRDGRRAVCVCREIRSHGYEYVFRLLHSDAKIRIT